MEILPKIRIVGLGLYLDEEDILVIADLHIGFEEALNKQGLMIPRFQFKEIVNKINNIINKIKKDKNKIDTIIINGDIKHEFGEISQQEWRETLKIIDLLQKNCQKLVLIKGNHDTILGPIANKKGIEIADYYNINDIYICHGHKIPIDAHFAKSKIIIIGHEHPALSLKHGSRVELYKCFLKGKYKNKKLVVMPSLNLVTEGTDVMKESLLSPFLQQDLKNFEAYVVADKIYYFGKLSGLR